MTILPEHLFVSHDGDLHDTRDPDWAINPLRRKYCVSGARITSVADLKAALRYGEHTRLGGYPLYFVASDGEALSFEVVRENFRTVVDSTANGHRDGWRVVGLEINYEDNDLFCAHTGKKIASAYGVDEEVQEEAEAPAP